MKVKFFNKRKELAARAAVGEDIKDVVAEYQRLGGYCEVSEEVVEKKKVTPRKTAKKAAKKTAKKAK